MEYKELVQKSKQGDDDAFSTLIKIFEKDLYRVAISMVKNDDDALDCIQDAILKAYEKIKKLNNEEYFKTWLIKILINQCNTLLSKRKKIVVLPDIKSEASYTDSTNEFEVRDVLENLEEELKILVVLYYFEDLSVKDISESLSIPEGTIKSRLSRARGKLKLLMNCDCKEMI